MKNYALISLLLLAALCAGAEDYWPQWRGPRPQRRQRGRGPADDLECERKCGLE